MDKTQTLFVEGHQICQADNYHVTIIKDGRLVFHCQCNEYKNEKELLDMFEFYKQIKSV